LQYWQLNNIYAHIIIIIIIIIILIIIIIIIIIQGAQCIQKLFTHKPSQLAQQAAKLMTQRAATSLAHAVRL
jgi:predicted Holliday junction resolvase-like endonuclease